MKLHLWLLSLGLAQQLGAAALPLFDAPTDPAAFALGSCHDCGPGLGALQTPSLLGWSALQVQASRHPGRLEGSSYQRLAAELPWGRWGLGLEYSAFSSGEETVEELDGSTRQVELERQQSLGVSLGKAVGQRFGAGATLRYTDSLLGGEHGAGGVSSDLGLSWRALDDSSSVSLLWAHQGGSLRYRSELESLPSELRAGLWQRLWQGRRQSWHLALTGAQSQGVDASLWSAGLQWRPWLERAALRGSAAWVDQQLEWRLGLGLRLGHLRFELAGDMRASEPARSGLRFGVAMDQAAFGLARAKDLQARGQAPRALALQAQLSPEDPDYAEAQMALRKASAPEREAALMAPLDPVPSANAGRRTSSAALVVGISRYLNVEALRFGAEDAAKTAEYLHSAAGIPSDQIRLLLDQKATKASIEANVNDWLARQDVDLAVVYFAGHGVPRPSTAGRNEAYFIPQDGDLSLPSTLLSLSATIHALEEGPARQVLVLADSCFSGAGGRSPAVSGQRGIAIEPAYEEGRAALLSSSQGSQPSLEYEAAGHGYFTYYLLLGLKGEADADLDGVVRADELGAYVERRLKESLQGKQTPLSRGLGPWELGRLR